MESWRIISNLNDVTERASTSSQIVGATVIKSPKGRNHFCLFSKGETKKVLETFGYPSKEYPSIQDALDVVAKSDLWIASPYKNGKYGGVFVTESGTISFVNGVSEKEINNFSEIECSATVGIGNSVITNFKMIIPNYVKYNHNTIGIKVGDSILNIESTDSETEVITDTEGILSEASFNRTNGELDLTFKVAPQDVIIATYTINVSDTIFVLFNADMQNDDLEVKVTKNKYVDDIFDISVSRYNPLTNDYDELPNSPFVVGLKENSKDSEGNNVFIENVFNDDNLLFTPSINNSVFENFTDDKSWVKLNGGNRGSEIDGSDLANIYDELQDNEKFSIKFAFDSTSSDEVISKFESLRENYQKRCRFLYCSPDKSVEEILDNPEIAHRNINNRGMYCYVLTWGIHKDVYQGNDFLCSNMGLITGKLVDVLNNGWGEPMWLNGDNNVGGQLGSSIIKLNRKATQSQLEKFADLFLNPIIMSKTYGPFIENASTRQTKFTVLSDIGISSLVDTILELIEKNVLPQRVGKFIDDVAYSNVRSGCNSILDAYAYALEDKFVLCDSTNNTPEMRNNETLVATVGIIPKKYAKKIIFNLTLHKSGVDIEEVVTNI